MNAEDVVEKKNQGDNENGATDRACESMRETLEEMNSNAAKAIDAALNKLSSYDDTFTHLSTDVTIAAKELMQEIRRAADMLDYLDFTKPHDRDWFDEECSLLRRLASKLESSSKKLEKMVDEARREPPG
jgi:DNA repair ATPase RecN